MVKTIKEERLRWVLPIAKKEVRLIEVSKVCTHGKRSLEHWLRAYKVNGEAGLEPKSTEPKTQKDETPIWIKERIIEVRKIKYKYIKAERQPGELIEIDVKYVPGQVLGKRYFQYTAIDTASKWRHLEVYDGQTNFHSILFLQKIIDIFPHKIQAIKTDNGSIFTNYYTSMTKRSDMTVKTIHALDLFCKQNNIIHYLIDPGKPAQNGTVERSHREDQEKFYEQNEFRSFLDLKTKIRVWNDYYNNLEHCGLNGKTPNEMLELLSINKPTNVCG